MPSLKRYNFTPGTLQQDMKLITEIEVDFLNEYQKPWRLGKNGEASVIGYERRRRRRQVTLKYRPS